MTPFPAGAPCPWVRRLTHQPASLSPRRAARAGCGAPFLPLSDTPTTDPLAPPATSSSSSSSPRPVPPGAGGSGSHTTSAPPAPNSTAGTTPPRSATSNGAASSGRRTARSCSCRRGSPAGRGPGTRPTSSSTAARSGTARTTASSSSACCCATRGEIEEAGPALLARVAAGGPDADPAREALVAGLIYRFRWAAAGRYLDEWLAAAPDNTAALLLHGKLEEQRLATGPAIENYRRVVELDPEHDEARLRLAILYLGNRQGDAALAHLAVLRASLLDHPEVAVLWARALALEGRGAESRAALAACLLAHPDYPPALTERVAQALTDGDEPEAERLLAKAVALDPGNVVTRGQYAFVLARTGKRDEAAREQARVTALKADLERITVLISGPLQERPNDPLVPFEIGQIALRSGEVREAIRWFTAALRIDPMHAPTHRVLAAMYRELDKPVLAARHRAMAQQSAPPPKP